MFHCSHPNAFFQPHLHPRGCSGEFLLGLGFQGCSGACSTPFSRLLQPSVRSVVDLGVMAFGHHPLHLLLFVDVSHFQLGSIQSMLLSVSQGDCWPPSISGKRTFQCRFILLLVPFFASCSVTRSTSSRLCALASPRLRRSSPGSWLLFQLYSILWVSVCVDTSTPGWSSLPLRSLSSRFFCLSSDFVTIVIHPRYSNLVPSQVVQYLWVVIDSTSFRASPSVARISRLQSRAAVFLSCA